MASRDGVLSKEVAVSGRCPLSKGPPETEIESC